MKTGADSRGTSRARQAPRRGFEKAKKDLEFRRWYACKIEPCLFTKSGSTGQALGLVLAHVGNFQVSRDIYDEELKAELKHHQTLCRWGLWKPDEEGYSACGVEASMNADMGFRLSQEQYVWTIQPLNIKRARRSSPDNKWTPDEVTARRALLGQSRWLRPRRCRGLQSMYLCCRPS